MIKYGGKILVNLIKLMWIIEERGKCKRYTEIIKQKTIIVLKRKAFNKVVQQFKTHRIKIKQSGCKEARKIKT